MYIKQNPKMFNLKKILFTIFLASVICISFIHAMENRALNNVTGIYIILSCYGTYCWFYVIFYCLVNSKYLVGASLSG